MRAMLLAIARGLRFGGATHYGIPATSPLAQLRCEAPLKLSTEFQGPYWLGQRLAEQVDGLRERLLETEPNWNIERRTGILAKV